MKNILALVLVSMVVLVSTAPPKEIIEEMKENIKQCITETGISQDELQKFENDDFSGGSHDFKCFVNCFTKKSGFMINSEPQIDKIKETVSKFPKYNEEKFDKATAECKDNVIGADECEKTFNFIACHKKNKEE